MKINRWWYSKKQKQASEKVNNICQVQVNGKWHEFTEWTTSLYGDSNWKDAILIAESTRKLPVMINGVIQ